VTPVGTMVEVDWLDHAFHFGPYEKDRPLDGLMVITSVGYVVKHDDSVLILAQSTDTKGGVMECLHLMNGCVLQVRELKRRKD
jgi:hypothetical protein